MQRHLLSFLDDLLRRRSSNASLALCNFEALNSICEFRQLWSCLETCTRISVFEPCTCIRKRGVPSLDSRQMARTELSLGASLRFLPKLERHQAFHSGTKMRLPHTRYSVALQFQHSRLIIYITDWNSIYNQICQLWPWESFFSFYLESYSVYSFRCYCQDSVAETLGPNSD